MSSSQHIFIHPWLNAEERWGGLMVASAGARRQCCEGLAVLCRDADASSLGHSLQWFVPLEPAGCTCSIRDWPMDRAVFLAQEPEDSETNDSWLEPVDAIRAAGGKVGVLVYPHHSLPPPGGKWDYVVLDTGHARTAPPVKLMVAATQSKIILSGVRTREDFEWGITNQAELLSSEFLLVRAKDPSKPDMRRVHLLQLLSLVTQDADTREIEEVFRQEPKLSYSLLRLVNSAALSLRTPVNSFSQAITLLGRRQLQRWLQLLVYADPAGMDRPNPLLQWAAMRGRLLELTFQQLNPAPQLAIEPDSAFMAGIFSLLDVLLNLPMEEILAQLPVATTVKLALTERAGPLGELLRAIEAGERRKFDLASEILTSSGVDCVAYAETQLAAIDWAHKINQQAG